MKPYLVPAIARQQPQRPDGISATPASGNYHYSHSRTTVYRIEFIEIGCAHSLAINIGNHKAQLTGTHRIGIIIIDIVPQLLTRQRSTAVSMSPYRRIIFPDIQPVNV